MTLTLPDSKVHGANMRPTWVLSVPDGPHVGPMSLAIRAILMTHPPVDLFTLFPISTLKHCNYVSHYPCTPQPILGVIEKNRLDLEI